MMRALLIALLATTAALPTAAADSADAQKHRAAAAKIAGSDLSNSIGRICQPADDYHAYMATLHPAATKVFDNFYFVGIGQVSSWALDTSDGFILFDTLNNADEAEKYVVGGMKQLGLDPARIKYIVITHGHGDHYGGARYLQDKYPQAKVLMSATDYALADKAAASPKSRTPAPRHDLVVTDGQKLTLGDTTVTMYITPGHTPGSISSIIPVKDRGTVHLLGMWGGTGYPASRAGNVDYEKSLDRFVALNKAAKVEGRMSNHPAWDDTTAKLERMKADPNGRNPFLETPEYMDRYVQVQLECLRAWVANLPGDAS